MSYMDSQLEQEAKEKQRRLDEENERVFQLICDRTDQTPGTAFKNALIKWMNGRLSIDGYDMLCATSALPGFADKSWHRGTVDYYLEKVVEKLRSRNFSDESIREKLRELGNQDKPKIRRYLEKLGFTETVSTLEQARDFLQRHRLDVASRQYFAPDGSGPYPRLAKNIVPVGFVTSVPLDAKYLNELASQDMAAFQRMVRRYHISQINERLQSTSDSLRRES